MGLLGRPDFEQPANPIGQVDSRWLVFALLSGHVYNFDLESPGGSRTDRAIRRSLEGDRFDQSLYSGYRLGGIHSFDFHAWTDGNGVLHQPVVKQPRYIKVTYPNPLPSGYRLDSYHLDPNSGFKASIYRSEQGGDIVISFRGTTMKSIPQRIPEWMDSIVVLGRGSELPDRYHQSVVLAKAVQVLNPGARITLTGHSVGGGQAAYAAESLALDALVFNATAIPEAKMPKELLERAGDDKRILKIININSIGDPVSNPFGMDGNYCPLSLPGSRAAQLGQRFFLDVDVRKHVPPEIQLSKKARVAAWLFAPRNSPSRSRVREGLSNLNELRPEMYPLHSLGPLTETLVARLESQGIDTSAMISAAGNGKTVGTPKNGGPIGRRARLRMEELAAIGKDRMRLGGAKTGEERRGLRRK